MKSSNAVEWLTTAATLAPISPFSPHGTTENVTIARLTQTSKTLADWLSVKTFVEAIVRIDLTISSLDVLSTPTCDTARCPGAPLSKHWADDLVAGLD